MKQRAGSRLTPILAGAVIPLVIIAVWQLIAVRLHNPSVLPRVEAVIDRLIHPFQDVLKTGSLFFNTGVSAFRVMWGFGCAVIIGIPLGLAMGRIGLVRRLFKPIIEVMRPLCPIAWIPFALAVFRTSSVPNLFGIRYTDTILDHVQIGMIFILFWGGFFPILLNTIYGVTNVKNIFIEAAGTLGASKRQVFLKVVLPAAMPSIMTGLRVGLGICWFVIIAAEMLPGSDAGIGYLVIYAYQLGEMDVIIAGMILIGLVGALLSRGLEFASVPVSHWQARER
jgi:NitT/TauT family transport system permease protein